MGSGDETAARIAAAAEKRFGERLQVGSGTAGGAETGGRAPGAAWGGYTRVARRAGT